MSFSDSFSHEVSGRSERKMRRLLLDRRFQLKYMAMILGVASLISAVLGTFLFMKVRENSRMLELENEANGLFQQQLAAADSSLMTVIVLSFVVFLLVSPAASLPVCPCAFTICVKYLGTADVRRSATSVGVFGDTVPAIADVTALAEHFGPVCIGVLDKGVIENL